MKHMDPIALADRVQSRVERHREAKRRKAREVRKKVYKGVNTGIGRESKPPLAEIARMRQQVPEDTRTAPAVLLGDPIPDDPRRKRTDSYSPRQPAHLSPFRTCQFPVSPDDAPIAFCGDATVTGHSWCAVHCRVVYQEGCQND